jgi:urease accessory protein
MKSERLLAVLQFADGLFPAGGFAHSFGLEVYTQGGIVRDRAGLEAFVRAHLAGSAGPGDAAAAACAARFAAAGEIAACLGLDERLDAMKWVPELRAASRQMGRHTARAAAALGDDPFVAGLAGAVDQARTPGHHALVFGAVTGRQGADPETAAAAFLHSTAALLVNAGLRLLPVGQLGGQRVLAAVRPLLAALAARAASAGPEDLWGFAPGLEIAGCRHADLETRLFRS